jgi:hypothetical protein
MGTNTLDRSGALFCPAAAAYLKRVHTQRRECHMSSQPLSVGDLARRIEKLERQNRALWSLLADWYAFRDEKNFADFIVHELNDAGGAIDSRAADRLQEMSARGPASRGDPVEKP